ncbi:NAD-dependent epimerase/dehydratase family protein [Variovorax ginsengisoli]|uniref:Nucleoside-diphosphate-sugar epimerase n=1 Tax=Variovorax ginsengisoli TaxID=363844 RepID=A0ABT9SBR3_9BURK|nr:NAD-dependent epimerase/dehydratase family protein [Variovorax ginsengisoli]MDP9901216.1 nucleoside-diphosphate-sugar epimerase [Variovorax ginsengisoli]
MSSRPSSSNPARPVVLILGANGRLGCAAAQAFHAAGWSVRAQVRREPSPLLPAGVDVLRIGLSDNAQLAAAAAPARVVVYGVNPLYTRWDSEALPGLQRGLDLAERLGAHFVLPGNVYNFGATMPAVLSETTPMQPSTRKGEIRVQMEALMARRAAVGGFRASVVRAGDFFGAGTGSWIDLVIAKSIASGKLVYPGAMDIAHAWAYLPDLARAFVRVAAQPQRPDTPHFDVWHFAGHTLTGAELLAELEAAACDLGLAPAGGFRHGRMPWRLLRAAGLLVPMWREVAAMAYLWQVPHALDGHRLNALAGGELAATPVRLALRASLLAMGVKRTEAA